MDSIRVSVQNTIKDWNNAVKQSGQDIEYILDVKVHNKKFYLNKKVFYENRVGEIKFIKIDRTKTRPEVRLLWDTECLVPKIKQQKSDTTENHVIDQLHQAFLYEAIGMFAVTTAQLQENKDIAEYDIDKDRIKQDESAIDMEIQCIENGKFYAKGDEFDVFMVTDNNYHVYTQHDIGLKNNGIASIPKEHCMVTKNAKINIILDI